MQYAHGIRKDVIVLAKADLKNVVVEKENENAKLHTLPFGERGNATIMKAIYLSKQKPIFTMLLDYNELNAQGKRWLMPHGILLKVANRDEQNVAENEFLKKQDSVLRSFTNIEQYPSYQVEQLMLVADIPRTYSNAWANTGIYLIARYKDYEEAKKYLDKALALDEDNDIAYEGYGDYFAYKDECLKAKKYYKMATEKKVLALSAYQKLYRIVTTCSRDDGEAKTIQGLVTKFPEIFRGVIQEERS